MQNNIGLMTLYNFFKNVCDQQAPLSADLFNDFYRKTLTFQHWRNHRQTLSHTVKEAINSYFRKHKPFATDAIIHADQLQILEVENMNEFLLITQRHLEKEKTEGERQTIKFDNKRNVIAIHLFQDGTLRIRQFNPIAFLQNGDILPLLPNMTLCYGPDLELSPEHTQHLKIDNFSSLHFLQTKNKFAGTMVRGYTLNRVENIEVDTFKRIPKLFLPLKRIERHFIDPKTDSYYIRLTEDLEKSVQLLNGGHPQAIRYACSVFERGRLAAEEIFPDDKLLSLLVKDLGNTIVIKTQNSQAHRLEVEEKWQNREKNQLDEDPTLAQSPQP